MKSNRSSVAGRIPNQFSRVLRVLRSPRAWGIKREAQRERSGVDQILSRSLGRCPWHGPFRGSVGLRPKRMGELTGESAASSRAFTDVNRQADRAGAVCRFAGVIPGNPPNKAIGGKNLYLAHGGIELIAGDGNARGPIAPSCHEDTDRGTLVLRFIFGPRLTHTGPQVGGPSFRGWRARGAIESDGGLRRVRVFGGSQHLTLEH